MSTFYLLPPRTLLRDYLADCLHALLPGIDLDVAASDRLWLSLEETLLGQGAFLVHREDLPSGERTDQALIDGYGAVAGDEIVEIRPGGRMGVCTWRRWRIKGGADTCMASGAA